MTTPQSPFSQEHLAAVVAHLLRDPDGLPFYGWSLQRYGVSRVFGVLGHVLSLPDEQIHRTRGALFNWIIRRADKASPEAFVPENLPVMSVDELEPVPGQVAAG
jgi:hypothetical protein